jgi:CRP/FNR family cyclic AMP-dependent transcriptional regulator
MSDFNLPRTGILAFMDDEARERFGSYGAAELTTPGQVIIREGEANLNLYVVLAGSFKVSTAATGQEVHLDDVGPGDCLGEVAVFQPGVTSATVICSEPGQLWHIDVSHLQQFLIDWPHSGCAAVLGINTILSRRLKRANSVIRSHQILPTFLSVRNKKRPESVS